jgi:hypothetical protein
MSGSRELAGGSSRRHQNSRLCFGGSHSAARPQPTAASCLPQAGLAAALHQGGNMPLAQIKRFFFGPGPRVSRDLAMRVFKRDHFKCQYCGLDGRPSFEHWLTMTIDHVHPYARGGPRHLENLVTACQPCNLIKGKRPFASFEDAKKYVLAKREEWRSRYEEQMKRFAEAA